MHFSLKKSYKIPLFLLRLLFKIQVSWVYLTDSKIHPFQWTVLQTLTNVCNCVTITSVKMKNVDITAENALVSFISTLLILISSFLFLTQNPIVSLLSQYNDFRICPYFVWIRSSFSLINQLVSRCMDIPQFVCSFTCWWTLLLFSLFFYYK